MSAITKDELKQAVREVILVQGNQSAPALVELFDKFIEYIDTKWIADVNIKTLGGQSLIGEGDLPTDFGGADWGGGGS